MVVFRHDTLFEKILYIRTAFALQWRLQFRVLLRYSTGPAMGITLSHDFSTGPVSGAGTALVVSGLFLFSRVHNGDGSSL